MRNARFRTATKSIFMYGNAMEDYLTKQSGKELLQKAVEYWKNNGLWDGEERTDGRTENGIKYTENMEKDPVINLFMTALAYQTNLLRDKVTALKSELGDEFVRRTLPYHLTRPVPAVTVFHAKLAADDVESYLMTDADVITLEKRSKAKLRFKEVDKFGFIPLFKTRILNVQDVRVQRTGYNSLSLTIMGKNNFEDLSGLSFYFHQAKPKSLSVSVNGVQLPVLSIRDFDRMPLCSSFDTVHSVFSQSLLYGTPESWADSVALLANSLFYIGDSDFVPNSKELNLQLTFGMDAETVPGIQDVLINCVPIVNVEKCSTSLSQDDPIKCLAGEKTVGAGNRPDRHKAFLNLLAPSDNEYDLDQITLRRFGAERYHVGQLVAQTHSLIHRYASDFHAFREFADSAFDDKLNALRILLKEIDQIVSKDNMPRSGVYVMLRQDKKQEIFNNGRSRVGVSYLLTDGVRGNDIVPGESVIASLPAAFDKESSIQMPTYGGRDEIIESEEVKMLSMYYNHSRDRLVTKSDVKFFCIKELMVSYRFQKEQIGKFEFQSSVGDCGYEMNVVIKVSPLQNCEDMAGFCQNVAAELEQKISVRTSDIVSYKVRLVVE